MNWLFAKLGRMKDSQLDLDSKDLSGLPRETGIIPGNAQDIGARNEQQDAFGFSDLGDWQLMREIGGLAVVADGIGGLKLGGQASTLVVRTMLEAYALKTSEETVLQALLRALRQANVEVLALAEQVGLGPGEVGTTLAAAVIHDCKLYWVSVGDSRIYLFRDQQLYRLTEDHSYLNRLLLEVEKGNLNREEALQDKDRWALTSFLGLPDLNEIDHSERPLDVLTGDQVLLCTDGVYGALSENEMLELMNGHPQEAAEGLLLRVKSKQIMNQDNMTVAVMLLKSNIGEKLNDSRAREDMP